MQQYLTGNTLLRARETTGGKIIKVNKVKHRIGEHINKFNFTNVQTKYTWKNMKKKATWILLMLAYKAKTHNLTMAHASRVFSLLRPQLCNKHLIHWLPSNED